MKLSAPVYVLKNKAKQLKRARSITMTEALDEIAKTEGFSSWSLLLAKSKELIPKTQEDILNYLNPGDLMLIGARPGLGKTTFTLQILLQAVKEKRQCYFFSLEYSRRDLAAKLADLDESIGQNNPFIHFDFSDEISSEYIVIQTKGKICKGSVIAVDYLQLLDQQRTKSELQKQVEELKSYAKETGCIVIFVSQVDRNFESSNKEWPGLDDIRQPNPVDLKLFNKTMFLHNGKKFFTSPAHFEIEESF